MGWEMHRKKIRIIREDGDQYYNYHFSPEGVELNPMILSVPHRLFPVKLLPTSTLTSLYTSTSRPTWSAPPLSFLLGRRIPRHWISGEKRFPLPIIDFSRKFPLAIPSIQLRRRSSV